VEPGGEDATRRQAAFEDLLSALLALPGVERVATGPAPVSTTAVEWEPRTITTDAGERSLVFGSRSVGDDYLDVLGIPLLAGAFGDGPAPDVGTAAQGPSSLAVVVTVSMAQALWPGTIPLGRTFAVGNRRYAVTGVVEDFVQGSARSGTRAGYVMPGSATRLGGGFGVVQVALRTRGPAGTVVPAVRTLVDARFPEAAQLEVLTGTALLERDLGRERLGAAFFSGYGVVSLMLGFAGVFGIVAYLAESRRKELGIRAALGATPRHLTRHAVGTGLVPVAGGTAVGLIAAVLMSRLVDSFLIGVSRLDAVSFAGAAGLMLAGAAAAGLSAAWRIRGLSPMDALRE
jgi:putative ABC transport system permease protein